MTLLKKWLFRLVLLGIFIVTLLLASDNSTEVPLTFLEYQTPVWPISWWMLSAFVTGVLFGTLLNTWSNTKLRIRARNAKRQAKKSAHELNNSGDSLPISDSN
ncbi:MAG: hypothetical protein CMQ20_06915 [Gammaproteobacteria bacterium]|mgnify:CR=1 FL=1|jgi:uncharacterized integral membrane protein|nr:hypothetical protein [Gammaproteobacteria bacterium]|tara:strand:+ start:213 stop:521 length:309 start_codon:yes stop_codon:yes gene_type:complete